MNEQGPTALQLALAIQRSDENPLHVAAELSSHGRSVAVALYKGLSPEIWALVDAEANTSTIALREAQICGEIIAESDLVTVTEHRTRVASKVLFGALEAGGRCVVVPDEGIARYRQKRRLTSAARTPYAQLSAISLLEPAERRSEETRDDDKATITDLGRYLIVIGLVPGNLTMVNALRALDDGRSVLILDTSDVLPTTYDVLLRHGAVAIQNFRHLQAHLKTLRTE